VNTCSDYNNNNYQVVNVNLMDQKEEKNENNDQYVSIE